MIRYVQQNAGIFLRVKLCAPSVNFSSLKKQGKGSKKKPLSKEAIRKIKYKQMMWKSYTHTGNEEGYIIYKEALRHATDGIRNSMRSQEQKFAFNIKHDRKFVMSMFKVNRKFTIRSVL